MKEKIYIFGVHSRAQTAAVYLQTIYPEITVEAYLYDNAEKNPESVCGIRTIHVCRDSNLHTDYPVYIGTRGIYHRHITDRLRGIGFTDIYPVTAKLDRKLRNSYMEKHFTELKRDFIRIDSLPKVGKGRGYRDDSGERAGKKVSKRSKSVTVYVVVSKHDRPLRQHYRLASYEKEIKAGAAFWESNLPKTAITDDTGDNISSKNHQFCELTALYWIWKHGCEDIIGLVQYRRHFILPEDWILRMEENDIDVILPAPLYVAPSIAENYKSRHDPSDWDAMMAYLKRQDAEEYRDAETFFQTSLYSPCNMFIMRRQVLDELCGWLFPILFAVAEQGGQKEDSYLNRYPGFLSERLITFFFERHRGLYKVVYCDKNFLE